MKRIKLCVVLLTAALTLTSCKGSNQEDGITSGYQVYYVNNNQTGVVTQTYNSDNKSSDQVLKELIEQLEQTTDSIEYISAKPSNVKLLDYALEGDTLRLKFDSEYYQMKASTEVLMRMAYVKTLVQASGVNYVEFYVEDQPLMKKNGVAVGAMNDDTFVQNDGSQINEYETSEMILYFASQDGKELVQSAQRVTRSSNLSLEKVVIEQLIQGPSADTELIASVPQDMKLLSVSTKDGVCYVNLSREFLTLANHVSAEVQLYSIVNSLAELPTISKVQIAVDGSSRAMLAMSIGLDQAFERNLDLVRTGGK